MALHKSKKSLWQKAKQSLTSKHGEVFDVVGRNDELLAVDQFITGCLESNCGSSLYVAGAPGCGKSAVMHVIAKNYETGRNQNGNQIPKIDTLLINCLQLEGVTELRSLVQSKREEIESAIDENQSKKKRRGRPKKMKKTEVIDQELPSKWMLVIADELDQLRGISEAQLFNDSHLIFIGVSNRLDLSDKVSATPRRSSIGNKRLSMSAPAFMIGGSILNFKPYTASQLLEIMNARLEKVAGASKLFQPPALMFCAKRVAACSGDARQALDLARRAMDLAFARSSVAKTDEDEEDALVDESVIVTVADVAQVVNAVFGSALNDVSVPSNSSSTVTSSTSGPTLPLHERLALVAVINCINTPVLTPSNRMSIGGRTPGRKGKNDGKVCPVMRVYAMYTSQCRKHTIDPLNQSDFTDVCGRLADKRLIAIAPPPAKQPLVGPSISLRVTADEMTTFLSKHSLCNLIMTNAENYDQ